MSDFQMHECGQRMGTELQTALSFHVAKNKGYWDLVIVGLPYPCKTEYIPIIFCPFCGTQLE
jgi:hypothetical protein